MESPQVVPPPVPAWFVPRPRVFEMLQGVFHHRLTLVLAGPGYGKSTILAAWGLAMGCAWFSARPADASVSTFARGLALAFRRRLPALRSDLESAMLAGGDRDDPSQPELLAGLICEALDPIAPSDLPLVIDSAEHLGQTGASLRLIEALCRQAPSGLHFIVASRSASAGVVLRAPGQAGVLRLGTSDLAFSLEETSELLASTVGPIQPDVLERLHARTAGWPAAIRLAVESLQNPAQGEAPEEVPFDAPFASLADGALRREPPEVLALIARMAQFDRFTPELCEALGIVDAGRMLASLASRGLFVQFYGGAVDWLTLHILLREYAEDRWPVDAEERKRISLGAAGWFAGRGHLEDALQALKRAGDLQVLSAFLSRHGDRLLAEGGGAAVIEAGALIPPDLRSSELETLLGWASRLRGDWVKAFEHYWRAAEGTGPVPAALAWRLAEAHYLRSELRETVDIAARADMASAGDHDRAMLLNWEASAYRRLGDRERAGSLARAAREIAERTDDAEAIAASVTTELGVLELPTGDPYQEARDLVATEASERSGNPWLRVRVLTNRAEALAQQARFREADALTETALRLAESSGDPFSVARTLEVRAMAAFGEGRLAEALDDGSASRTLYERAGSQMVAQALLLLGHVHREAGELAAAGLAYREALDVGTETGNTDVIQEALAGQTRLQAIDDPAEARRLSDRGLLIRGGPDEIRCQMVLAAGWTALAESDLQRAQDLAQEAVRISDHQGYRGHRAESMELGALARHEPDAAMLERARNLWQDAGNQLGVARVELALATLASHESGERPSLGVALRRLQGMGVHPAAAAGAAGLLAVLPQPEAPPLEIRTLGGFAVLRYGVPVPFSEWKSRKARDLLKILVAKRGRPTHREALMEALWPEEPPDRVANRLSVAMAVLRSVLDPGRALGTQTFVTGESESVRLNVDQLVVDSEVFLLTAHDVLRNLLSGTQTQTVLVELEAAEALYSGDFLEEDPYEDWAVPLREEAKTLYIELCRSLAASSLHAGRHESAARYGLKIISRDPFDEVAHLLIVRALVSSGRHGEARRRYRMYVASLAEIGVPPSPYPGAA